MKARVTRWVGGALAVLLTGAGLFGTIAIVDGAARRQALKSNDLTGLRHEALALFPRGSRLEDASVRLADMGFRCDAIPHPLPDISGPSLRCASNGRGYPDFPAVTVILLERNGLISDVDVWNIMARADHEPDDIDFTAIGSGTASAPELRGTDASEESLLVAAGSES